MDLESLANLGVRELGVAPVSKERFARSLSVSAVVAGFAKQVGEKISFINPDSGTPGEAHEREIDDSIQVTADLARAVAFGEHASGSTEPVHVTAEPGNVVGGTADRGEAVAERMVSVEAREQPALLHRQSWEIGGGSLDIEIRLNQSLPAEAFIQLGKVMTEVERLKAILADEDEAEPAE